MKHYPVVIVGAGVSGRLAKLMCKEALLIEASSQSNQRIAAMVGVNYLHEDIPELVTRPIKIQTGIRSVWREDNYFEDLKPIRGPEMARYQNKCRGKDLSEEEGRSYLEERGSRYDFNKTGFAYDLPQTDIEWETTAIQVNPASRSMVISKGSVTQEIRYDMLVWTAPFNALYTALGFDPRSLNLVGKPIYYRSERITDPNDVPDQKEFVEIEYVHHMNTPVYRRTVYFNKDGSVDQSLEAIRETEGFDTFWPGKVILNEKVLVQEQQLIDHDIILAGRFARWDPDELTHHTATKLRRVLL